LAMRGTLTGRCIFSMVASWTRNTSLRPNTNCRKAVSKRFSAYLQGRHVVKLRGRSRVILCTPTRFLIPASYVAPNSFYHLTAIARIAFTGLFAPNHTAGNRLVFVTRKRLILDDRPDIQDESPGIIHTKSIDS